MSNATASPNAVKTIEVLATEVQSGDVLVYGNTRINVESIKSTNPAYVQIFGTNGAKSARVYRKLAATLTVERSIKSRSRKPAATATVK